MNKRRTAAKTAASGRDNDKSADQSANNHLHDEQTGGYSKMSKRLILTDKEGNKYTLEFNRITVDRMQRNGFVLDTDRLYMSAKDLISGAFRMHHRGMEWPEIEKVWKAQNRRDELLKKLVEMFYAPTIDLMGTADEKDEEENPTWAEET